MPKIRLKKIEVEAFRSLVDFTEIEFPESGLFLIKGKNLDTGGSSGSGKSSIVLAVSFGFDACPFSATNLQSFPHLTNNSYKVKHFVEVDGVNYNWSKGDSQNSYFNKGSTRTASNSSGTTSKIRELIGVDSDILAALTYRSQKSNGTFLSMGDTAKKDFLNKVLNLEELEKAVELSEDSIKKLEDALKTANTEFQLKQSFLKDLIVYKQNYLKQDEGELNVYNISFKNVKEELKALNQRYLEIQEKEKLELESKAAAAKKEIPYFNERIDQLVVKRNSNEQLLKEIDYSIINTMIVSVKEKTEKLETMTSLEAELKSAHSCELKRLESEFREKYKQKCRFDEVEEEINEIIKENQILKSNKCPTCDRQWDNVLSKIDINLIRINRLNEEFLGKDEFEKSFNKLQEKIDNHVFIPSLVTESLSKDVFNLNGQIQAEKHRLNAELDSKKRQLDSEINEIKLKVKGLEAKSEQVRFEFLNSNKETDRLYKFITDLTAQYNMIKLKLDSIHEKMQDSYNHNKEEDEKHATSQRLYDKHALSFDDITNNKSSIESSLSLEKDFLRLVGKEGFLSCIFDEILVEISEEANRILSEIPNTSRCSVIFSSEKTTQKGTVKKTITPIVKFNDAEGPYKAILSGGMITSLELAVDLAVYNVISNRTGIKPGWLILDESFEGLGIIEKEACLQILSNYAKDMLVLVIDHSTDFKEMFEKVITVVYENEKSHIE